MIDSPDASSIPWPLLMLANLQFWKTVIIPGVTGLISFWLGRFVSRRAAITGMVIMVVPWSAYWFVKSVPGLSFSGMFRAVMFIACLTLIPMTVASLAGIAVGMSRRLTSIPLAVALVLGAAIVAVVVSTAVAFSLIQLVHAQG